MPPTLQKLATYICGNADHAMRQTVEDVAATAGCSEGTVIRLCKDLGFSGFQELKLALAVETARLTNARSAPDRRKSIAERVIDATQEAISETRHLVNEADLKAVADLLLAASRIQVFGVGASAHVAAFVEYKLMRFGLPARAVSDTHMGFMLSALLGKHDVSIGVSSSGSTIDVVDVIAAAKARGATAVALTNRPRSRLAKVSDYTLGAAMPEAPLSGGSVASKITQLLVIDMLMATMTERQPSLGRTVKATAEAAVRSSY